MKVNYTKTALALIITVAVVLIVLCACGLPVVEVTIAWIGLLATALGVYQWKTKMKTARSTRRNSWTNGPRNTARTPWLRSWKLC